jgi:hypothetical protein
MDKGLTSMPDSRTIMHRSILHVETDLERIGAILRTVDRELKELPVGPRGQARVAAMNEQLSEVRTRIEGLYAFLQTCKQKVDRAEESEDVDVWL